MIMDADVLFEPVTLRRMARHLADPSIGGVTAYVKEGSYPGACCRASSRSNISPRRHRGAARAERHGWARPAWRAARATAQPRQSDRDRRRDRHLTLAEDTFTTFKTQLAGRRVLFDANAIVWAEEPDSVIGAMEAALRWGRGNLQITAAFLDLWFRPRKNGLLGDVAFGILWFSIALMPLFMFAGSFGRSGSIGSGPRWHCKRSAGHGA